MTAKAVAVQGAVQMFHTCKENGKKRRCQEFSCSIKQRAKLKYRYRDVKNKRLTHSSSGSFFIKISPMASLMSKGHAGQG